MALTWEQHQKNIFGGESGGDYDALFGFQNRPNGMFSDVKVSEMSIGEVLDFTNPRGKYGQYVARTRPDPEKGVATPVGAYQVVGSTLRKAVDALGLDPNTKFDKATQDKIGQYILKTQGTGAWVGYGKGGASMDNRAVQMAQPQQGGMLVEPEERKGLLAGLLGGQGIGQRLGMSEDFRDKLKMGLLMGSDPRRFAPMVDAIQAGMQERRDKTKLEGKINKTVEWLKSQGREDLAGAVLTGTIDPSSAINAVIAVKKEKTYQYQQLAKDLFELGIAKTKKEALQMALAQTKAGTTVNVGPKGEPFGNPPKDTVWKRNQDGTVFVGENGAPVAIPITGSQASIDAAAEENARNAKKSRQATSGMTVLQDINSAIDIAKKNPYLTTGFVGSILKNVGGTEAYDLNQLTETVRANIGFDRLDQMRKESPTGGALGQVAIQELKALQASLGSLETAQSNGQLVRNLERLQGQYSASMQKLYQAALEDEKKGLRNAITDEPISVFDYFSQSDISMLTGQPQPAQNQSQPRTDDELMKKYGDQ